MTAHFTRQAPITVTIDGRDITAYIHSIDMGFERTIAIDEAPGMLIDELLDHIDDILNDA